MTFKDTHFVMRLNFKPLNSVNIWTRYYRANFNKINRHDDKQEAQSSGFENAF